MPNKRRTIFLSAGHASTGDRGARGVNGIWEGDLTIELRDLIAAELRANNVSFRVDRNTDALSATIAAFRSLLTGRCLAIDIHFNAFNGSANGAEVIIPANPTAIERGLATALQRDLVSIGLRDRGVKTEAQTARKSLGWMRQPAETVLLEVCFIDNQNDVNLYRQNINELAKRMARTIIQFSQQ